MAQNKRMKSIRFSFIVARNLPQPNHFIYTLGRKVEPKRRHWKTVLWPRRYLSR